MSPSLKLSAALVRALKAGDLKAVRDLVEKGEDIRGKSGKRSALELLPPRADALKVWLIKAGARHPDLKQSLVWACLQNDLELVELLLDYGADLHQRARLGTPLMAAINLAGTEILERLLQAGADANQPTTMATPLSKAVVKDRPDIVKRLLESGADPDITPKNGGLTPLHVAIHEDRRTCLELLLEAGADPNKPAPLVLIGDPAGQLESHRNCPPVHLTLLTQNAHLLPLLLKHGADPSARDEQGRDLAELARCLELETEADF